MGELGSMGAWLTIRSETGVIVGPVLEPHLGVSVCGPAWLQTQVKQGF